jgi:hypothetical protein
MSLLSCVDVNVNNISKGLSPHKAMLKYKVRISIELLAILTVIYSGFPQTLQARL